MGLLNNQIKASLDLRWTYYLHKPIVPEHGCKEVF